MIKCKQSLLLLVTISLGLIPRVPEVFFSVSWEVRIKTSGNDGHLTDRAAPIGFM